MPEVTCAICGTPLLGESAACPSCDTATGITTPDFPELPGFQILRQLGRGGMGTVYLADDLTLGRKVAIKVLSEKHQGDREARDRFLVEARALAGIDHPNVLRIHSLGEAEGTAFIVTEYVEGQSLAERIKKGPMPAGEVLRLARQAAAGLAAAWEKGIVHRDVKPSNLLIDAAGQLRVADFGLAKPVHVDMSFATSKGVVLGTPHYVSPEQARGEPVDLRSDIYSLGVALYEMATGKRPFAGSTPVEILAHHIHSPMPSLAAATTPLSPALEHAISRMTQKRPADRPGSYAELSKLLTDDGSTLRRVRRYLPAGLGLVFVAAVTVYVSAPSSSPPGPTAAPTKAPDLGGTYDERGVDVAPKYLSGGTADSLSEYLPGAGGKEGCLGTISVVVEFVVTPGGDVTELQVKSAKLAGGAMLGVSTRKYSPARKSGAAVRVKLRRRYEVPSYFKSLAGLRPQVALIQQGKMPADVAVGCIEVLDKALGATDPAFRTEAIRGLAAIAHNYPVDDADLDTIGWILLQSRYPKEAMQVFEARLARLPGTAHEYERIADGLAAVGQQDAALKAYRLALALEPGQDRVTKKIESAAANPEGTYNGARVYTEGETDVSPKLVNGRGIPRIKVPPGEPTQAMLSWVVTPKGEVAEFRVHRSTSLEVEQTMIAAVQQWRYEPGRKAGEIVPVKVVRKYTLREP